MTTEQFERLINLCTSHNEDDRRLGLVILSQHYLSINPLWVRYLLNKSRLLHFYIDYNDFSEIPNAKKLVDYWRQEKDKSKIDIRDWKPDKNYFITKEEFKNEES